jgi:5-formyltetrahydrofolate cyclo-ligase
MKKLLRSQFGKVIAGLDLAVRAKQWRAVEAMVLNFCLRSSRFEEGSVVTLFGGLPDEVDLVAKVLAGLIKGGLRPALFGLRSQDGGRSCFGEMDAFLVDSLEQVKRGGFGIWEPDPSRTSMVRPEELAAVLVPGLFFSEATGARLGRGGGFFDRYLARTPVSVMKVGVAQEWQLRDDIPLEDHDQRMEWLVTNERVIRCS